MSVPTVSSTDITTPAKLVRLSSQPENPFSSLIQNQQIAVVPSFVLESGVKLHNVPVAYSTWGKLSPQGNNALIICHAVSGSADMSDWWGPLMGGPGRAFDISRFFVVCLNSLGSPYGTASPVTNVNGDPKLDRYGPEFPSTTIRDDVNLHKIILDDLGIRQIAAVVGGSMGGMLVLEYAFFGHGYVRSIVPIASSSRHSAWGISWGEAQRQSIYSDPNFEDGYYPVDAPPSSGLAAARMAALLTYRSRDSFEARFGRDTANAIKKDHQSPHSSALSETCRAHNDGNRNAGSRKSSGVRKIASPPSTPSSQDRRTAGNIPRFTDPQFSGATVFSPPTPPAVSDPSRTSQYFSAQSYLRYQGAKFVQRFDSNCYLALTRKLDTHDISRNRVPEDVPDAVARALRMITQPALVMGIESDGLFTFAEQQEMAASIRDSRLRKIESSEGHDAFLLQFEQVNKHILEFFNEVLPDIMDATQLNPSELDAEEKEVAMKTSSVSEVDDITNW